MAGTMFFSGLLWKNEKKKFFAGGHKRCFDRRRMGRLIRKRKRLKKLLSENGQKMAVVSEKIARLEQLVRQGTKPSPD